MTAATRERVRSGASRRRLSILAEWTNFCNLKCNICPITKPDMRPRGHMSLELWGKILECCRREGHFVDWAHFYGEPLIWKHFFDGMRMWRESGLSRIGRISTNGHMLTDDRIDCIAETGLRYVRVCLDTLRPDVYNKLRENPDHEGLLAKTERFLQRAPNVHCQIQFIRSRDNADERPEDFLARFRRYDNISVFMSDCQDIGGDPSLSALGALRQDPSRCPKVDYEHCPITWDGQIGMCCLDYAMRNKFGDLSGDSIRDVYMGEYAEKVRSLIKQGDFRLAPYCPRCPADQVGYQCREFFPPGIRSKVRRLVSAARFSAAIRM